MATKRKGIRKNRKIKFSEKNYIEKTYMRRGKAVIPVKLEKISDLYMEHDYKQVELADSVWKNKGMVFLNGENEYLKEHYKNVISKDKNLKKKSKL